MSELFVEELAYEMLDDANVSDLRLRLVLDDEVMDDEAVDDEAVSCAPFSE